MFEETSGSKLSNMGVTGCQNMVDTMLEKGGGVIFIDEAYQLTSGNSPGGGAVLDYLLAEVENLMGKIVFWRVGEIIFRSAFPLFLRNAQEIKFRKLRKRVPASGSVVLSSSSCGR